MMPTQSKQREGQYIQGYQYPCMLLEQQTAISILLALTTHTSSGPTFEYELNPVGLTWDYSTHVNCIELSQALTCGIVEFYEV